MATPEQMKLKSSDPNWLKPRGVLQRNAGLTWIRSSLDPQTNKGVVYFADDDNTYSVELFEEVSSKKIAFKSKMQLLFMNSVPYKAWPNYSSFIDMRNFTTD